MPSSDGGITMPSTMERRTAPRPRRRRSRSDVAADVLALGAALGPLACAPGASNAGPAADGRITARPQSTPTGPPLPAGENPLGLSHDGRDGLIYVPGRAFAALLLRCTRQDPPARITSRTGAFDLAEALGVVVLAPDSREARGTRHGAAGAGPQRIARCGKSARERRSLTSLRSGRILRRRVRAVAQVEQRRRLQPRHRVLARIHQGARRWASSDLRVARHARRHPAGRRHQPEVRAGPRERRGAVRHREFNGGHTVPPRLLVRLSSGWRGRMDYGLQTRRG